jgi:hypothetical protein
VVLAYGSSTYAISVDGITWTFQNIVTADLWYSIVYGDGNFMAIATSSGVSAISKDGLTWIQINTLVVENPVIAFGNGSFVCVAHNYMGLIYTGSVPSPRMQWLSKEYRTTYAIDDTILTKHLKSTVININSLLINETDAVDEASRQLTMRSTRRDYIQVKCKFQAVTCDLHLGSIFQLVYARFGYDSGKLFVLIGFELFLETKDVTLFFWG